MSIWLPRLLLGATAALLSVATYRYVAESQARRGDEAEDRISLDTEYDSGEIPIGYRNVEFPIKNTGTKPRRLVGASAPSCGLTCCWVPMELPNPVVIGPGEAFVFRCRLEVKQVGPFEVPMTLYLEDAGLRTITLRVRGTGVPKVEDAQAINSRP
jgi:hypothetical protein